MCYSIVAQSILSTVSRNIYFNRLNAAQNVVNFMTVDSCTRRFVWSYSFAKQQQCLSCFVSIYDCLVKHAWVCLMMTSFPNNSNMLCSRCSINSIIRWFPICFVDPCAINYFQPCQSMIQEIQLKDVYNIQMNALFLSITVVLLCMRMCQTSYVCSTITHGCQWCCHQACSLNNESVWWSAGHSTHSNQSQLQTKQSLKASFCFQSISIVKHLLFEIISNSCWMK